MKKHAASQRHPAWAILLTLIVGLLLWLAAASLVRGIQEASAAETATKTPAISFVPAPALAQKEPATKPSTAVQASKPDSKSDRKRSSGTKSDDKKSDDKNSQAEQASAFSPAEETAVQGFLAANHPELGQILGSLKKMHAREYARAIKDLSHTHSRLEQVRRNDEERYQRDLEAWQLKSRIQLLVARIKMSPGDEKLTAELQQAVAEQLTQQREQLSLERDRLQQRLEKIDAQLERLSGDSANLVDQRMKQWLSSAENSRVPNPAKKKQQPTSPVKVKNNKVNLQP